MYLHLYAYIFLFSWADDEQQVKRTSWKIFYGINEKMFYVHILTFKSWGKTAFKVNQKGRFSSPKHLATVLGKAVSSSII